MYVCIRMCVYVHIYPARTIEEMGLPTPITLSQQSSRSLLYVPQKKKISKLTGSKRDTEFDSLPSRGQGLSDRLTGSPSSRRHG